MKQESKNLKIYVLLIILGLSGGSAGLLPAAEKDRAQAPAGALMRDTIFFQFAVYYLPESAKDPLKVLKQRLPHAPVKFKLVTRIPKSPKALLIQASLVKDVQKQYSPPSLDSLRYFGRGLSRDQAQALQHSQRALILNFSYPRQHVWDGLRAANILLEDLARRTGGLVWDEMTREVFTPDAWHAERLSDWTGGVPDISTQTTIHAYKSGEFVRAISLGMVKVGLPDVVVDDFSWSSNRSVGHLINLFSQAMAEGARLTKPGEFELNIRAIRHRSIRDKQLKSLYKNATALAHLTLRQGKREEGDPDNRLIQITFDRYPGQDVHARQEAMLSSLFGSQDSITYVKHNAELLAASKRAKAKLPALRAAFHDGLQPGEFIEVKAPFATPDGGNEWMWVEISKWNGDEIVGLLRNEPYHIPSLHSGQIVKVRQEDIFDYIRRYPNGKQEGNETGAIIEKMQQK